MASIRFDINTKTEDVLARFSGSVKGKTYVITGPSVKSLGAAVAQALAAGNAKQLILVGRSKAKIQPVIDDIAKHYPSVSVHLVAVDLLDLSSIRGGAKAIMDITNEIHGLVNCAGIMAPVTYSESADGIESQFACNHVAHFLLTNLLMDELARGKAVVVNVSSGGYTLAEVRFDDIDFQKGEVYDAWVGYGQSKTANILFSVALTQKAAARGVFSIAADPGYVAETSLQSNSSVSQEHFMKGFELAVKRNDGNVPAVPEVSTAQGAANIILPLFDPSIRDSRDSWIKECQVGPVQSYANDHANAERLWQLSEKLVGQSFQW